MKQILFAVTLLCLSTTSHADDELTLLLDWFINPDHAPLILAEELGYFADEGLKVTMVEPADPSLPPRLVAAGKADLAVTYQPQLHMQIAEGLPLTRIATLVPTPLNSLVVLADGPIQEIPDLAGKRIGFSVGGFEDTLLGTMLGTYGVDFDEVELVNVNFSLSPSLLSGQVDAVIGAFRNFELNQLDIEGRPGRAFYPEEEGVPVYDELILVVANEQRDDPRIPRFIVALERATTWLINHPDEAWALFAATNPTQLDTELNRRAWSDTLPRLALRPAALDVARYEAFATYLQEQGIVNELPPVADYAIVPR